MDIILYDIPEAPILMRTPMVRRRKLMYLSFTRQEIFLLFIFLFNISMGAALGFVLNIFHRVEPIKRMTDK